MLCVIRKTNSTRLTDNLKRSTLDCVFVNNAFIQIIDLPLVYGVYSMCGALALAHQFNYYFDRTHVISISM